MPEGDSRFAKLDATMQPLKSKIICFSSTNITTHREEVETNFEKPHKWFGYNSLQTDTAHSIIQICPGVFNHFHIFQKLFWILFFLISVIIFNKRVKFGENPSHIGISFASTAPTWNYWNLHESIIFAATTT
jgi:hypothetical protein